MNFMVGELALFVVLLALLRAESPLELFAVCAYFLFSFTCLFVGVSLWLELDMSGFGRLCSLFFVAITTVPLSLMSLEGGDMRIGFF